MLVTLKLKHSSLSNLQAYFGFLKGSSGIICLIIVLYIVVSHQETRKLGGFAAPGNIVSPIEVIRFAFRGCLINLLVIGSHCFIVLFCNAGRSHMTTG